MQGHIHDGVVVLDGDIALPEGTLVVVTLPDSAESAFLNSASDESTAAVDVQSRTEGGVGLVEWLLVCPEADWFEPLSDTPQSIKRANLPK